MDLWMNEFAVRVSSHPTDNQYDLLAASEPGVITHADGTATLEFDIPGDSLTGAILDAIAECDAVGLAVTGIEPVELVLPVVVADRCRMTEAALLARVETSAAIHPKPMSVPHTSGGPGFYRWSEVAQWLEAHHVPQAYDRTIEATDRAVKLTDRRDPLTLARVIDALIQGNPPPWTMPAWMVPYAPLIGNTGLPPVDNALSCAHQVESLLYRLHNEPRLAMTNAYVFNMACTVAQQVGLLARLHADGLLNPVVAP